MDKRFSRMIESGTRLTFVVMLLFAAVTWVKIHWAAGLCELILVGLLFLPAFSVLARLSILRLLSLLGISKICRSTAVGTKSIILFRDLAAAFAAKHSYLQ